MLTRFRSLIVAAVAMATMSTLLFGSAASAEVCIQTPTGRPICIDTPAQHNPLCEKQEPNGEPGQDGHDPLCPTGPAECIAYGMFLSVDPMPGAPNGATSHLARSHAQAQAWAWNGFAYAQGDSDASTQRADVPPALGEGVVESSCSAFSYTDGFFTFNSAYGTADAARVNVDLSTYGVPVTVAASVLREEGSASTGFAGYNKANVTDATITVSSLPAITVPGNAAPNTAIPLPAGLGTLYLNEQFAGVTPWGCASFAGDAMRLVLNRPGIGGQITLILSWVANAAC